MVLSPKQEKPLAIHHRKRQGGHHKRSKPYEKTYWPYLPLLAIGGLAVLVNLAWPYLTAGPSNVLGASSGMTAQQLLLETNEDRADDGKRPLTYDAELEQAAQKKAQDMASRDYWSHVAPGGKQPWDFAKESGYTYEAIGENLAYGFATPNDVIGGWMKSQEHRMNMLDAGYSEVGFGVVKAADFQDKGPQTIVVALYANPAPTLSVTATVINPTTATNDVLPARTVARSDQLIGTYMPGLTLVIAAAAAIGFAVFLARHLSFLHRVVVKGEAFVISHPHLDILLISVVVLAALLSGTAGYIH